MDVLGAHPGAAFGDVAVSDAVLLLELDGPALGVEGMHLQRRDINQETGSDELIVFPMVAQNVANILAKKALDALPKFLHAINVLLLHAPCSIRLVRRARLKLLDLFLYAKIPRNIRDQVFDDWKRLHRLNGNRVFEREIAQPRHAHQFRHAVDFR